MREKGDENRNSAKWEGKHISEMSSASNFCHQLSPNSEVSDHRKS
jgi:hypothetical protein